MKGLNRKQRVLKRIFDLLFALIGILIFILPIILLIIFATISTRKFGLYSQPRVGQEANIFIMFKIRTMKGDDDGLFISLKNSTRVTPFGKYLRKLKLDELPQLFNVLFGNMSFVGPRPDVVGYADMLQGDDRIILTVKPGITGPATIKFKHEEELLSVQSDPIKYNDEVIWKEKVNINKKYVTNWSFKEDLKFILETIFG